METISRMLLAVLINSLWQVALVAAVATVCARLTRAARFQHWLWVIALALGVFLPTSSALRSTSVGPPLARASAPAVAPQVAMQRPVSPVRAATPGDLPPLANRAAISPEPRGRSSYPWLRLGALAGGRARPVSLGPLSLYALVSVYLLFLLYRLMRLAQAWNRTDQIRRSAYSTKIPDLMTPVVARCEAALGLRAVSILGSSQISGPLTLGIRRAAIVLPEGMFQSTSSQELTAALCHEMAHIRRHDFLMNLVYELALLPLSFHPAARLIKRRIDETRELACDEMAAGRIVNAASYARSLVSLARAMSSLPARPSLAGPGYTLSVFDADILEERIMKLLDKRPRPTALRAKMALVTGLLLLAATCAAALTFSLTVAAPTKAAVDESTVRANFSGRWELDKTRSDLPSPSPDDFVQVIELDDPHLKITTTSKDWTAAEARAGLLVRKPMAITLFALTIPEFSADTNNQETVQKYGPGQLRSKTRWEGDNLGTDWTLEWTLERGGQAEVIGTWVRSLSSDGQIQTVEVKARDPQRGVEGKATLVFVKRPSGADLESFAGTWVGNYEGATYVIATLRAEEGKLAGTVSLGNFGVDRDGQVNNVHNQPEPAHAQPVVDSRLQGDTLRVTTRALGGKDNVFEVRASGGNELKIKWSPPRLFPDAPVPGWWKIKKESESSQGDIMPGGPIGGVVGGVVGGVRGGVPGPLARNIEGVPGGVADGVPGGVQGGVLPGAPRDDAQPSIVTISGAVFDPSGARVPGAIVSVKDKEIGSEQASSREFAETAVADDVGEFSFQGLVPGHYVLEVIKPGFAVYRQQLEVRPDSAVYQDKNYALGPGVTQPLLSIVLMPGEVLENVEVTALAPPGSRASSQSSGPRRIRVGGLVQATKLVEQTKPQYPESARAKGIQGVVLLQAVISKEGEPLSLKVLNSPDPALSGAAMAAVQQWRYEPTLLNGDPIEVVSTIAVRFHLEP